MMQMCGSRSSDAADHRGTPPVKRRIALEERLPRSCFFGTRVCSLAALRTAARRPTCTAHPSPVRRHILTIQSVISFPPHAHSFPNVYLLVGVCNDALTHQCKGLTVMSEEERYESVAHCKWVDEVVRDAPWCVDAAFLEAHAIDFVAHDEAPYPVTTSGSGTAAVDDAYAFAKRANKFVATQRTEGVSTSDLILRLLKNYNQYVLRNLTRGYTRQEMNVSLLREKRLRLQGRLQKLQKKVHEHEARIKRLWSERGQLGAVADMYAQRFLQAVKSVSGRRDGGRRLVTSDSELSLSASE